VIRKVEPRLPDDHLDDRQPSLLANAPHFCPKCMTGYGCEDEPCTAAYMGPFANPVS
jgi:hypothetical protein